MMRMHENGLTDRENSKMYTKKPRCAGHTGAFFTASLVDVKPAVFVLLWGILASTMLFVIEHLVHLLEKRRHAAEHNANAD